MDVFASFHKLVESSYQAKKLSKTCYENLIKRNPVDIYELDHDNNELQYFLENAEYYITLDSLEQGIDFVKSIDPSHKLWEAANAKCERLRSSLEKLTPRGESA